MDKEKIKSVINKVKNDVILAGIIIAVVSGIILKYWEENKPSEVLMFSGFDVKQNGKIDNEWIPISYGGGDDSCIAITITNKNDTPIDINDIIMEVIDYKSLNEFTIENMAGGADESIYYWLCNISNEKKEYHSTYLGDEKDGKEDKSEESHLVVEAKGLEQIRVKLMPDTPGLYVVKGSVEYVYNGKKEREELGNEKFIFDPNFEANYK